MSHLKENNVFRREAREALNGKWALAVLGCVIYGAIYLVSSQILAIFSILVNVPLTIGITIFYLSLSRSHPTKVEMIFKGFNERFGTYIWASVIIFVRVLLWTLLLIVPGIIAAISYSQTFFVLSEDNSVKAVEAIERSKKMMMGYKWKYFLLKLSFIGWGILSVLTAGVGFLWLIPYMYVTQAKFYDALKANN